MDETLSASAAVPLGEIATVALEAGRLLMEAGASGRFVDENVLKVARGLGAETVDLRIGYASLSVSVGRGAASLTRVRRLGAIGVNQRLDHAVRRLAADVELGRYQLAAVREALEQLVQGNERYPAWLVALAVGTACASFGRLLGVDWAGIGPVWCAATLGQALRMQLHARRVNAFIGATLVALVTAGLSGGAARWTGSATRDTAMIASVLLLVPGVPALNALNDILEGRPTLGSARAVWVAVMLVFATAGVWLAQALVGGGS